jgi:SAM-dependent methyltransferase
MNSEQKFSIRTSTWSPKNCDVCGGSKLELLGVRNFSQRNRSAVYKFELKDTLCLSCGFVFAGEVPDAEFLNEYYADAFTPDSLAEMPIKPDYNSLTRIQAIQQFLPLGSKILEIGSNTGEFCGDLIRAGYEALGVDPVAPGAHSGNQVGFLDGTGLKIGAGIANSGFDAVVSYYVLEHVQDARKWISSWDSLLREGGKVFIEVPNFYSYPRESLVHEHLLHFSPVHLAALLQSLDFEVLSADLGVASRPFGFCLVAAKTKSKLNLDSFIGAGLVEKGRSAYVAASRLQQREDAAYKAMVANLGESLSGEPIQFICWGANRFAARAFNELTSALQANDVVVVDNSLQKIGLRVEELPIEVAKPDFARRAPKKRVFLLCSPSHNPAIRAQILGMQLENVEIFDTITWLNDFDSSRNGVGAGIQLIPQRK